MAQSLAGSRIAILATDGVERSELREWLNALAQEGAEIEIVAPQGMEREAEGDDAEIDRTLDDVRAENYDAIVLPDGFADSDQLRIVETAASFVRDFFDAKKPTAVVCPGPWTLIEAGADRAIEMMSWPSFKTDLRNVGARWDDDAADVDRGIVGGPDDLPFFAGR